MRLFSGNLPIVSLCVAAVLLMPALGGCGGGTGESAPAEQAAEEAAGTAERAASTAAKMTEDAEPTEEADVVTAIGLR